MLSSPAPGASFAGGGIVPLAWTASDDQFIRSFEVQASTDGGLTWNSVARGLPATATSYAWRLPPTDGIPDVRVKVIAIDRRFQDSSDQRAIVVTAGSGACPADHNADGTVNLVEGSMDIGGSRAAAAMHVAEVLGIAYEAVRPSVGDTDSIGFTSTTGGSSATFKTGWACYQAAHDVKGQMIERAARPGASSPKSARCRSGVGMGTSTGLASSLSCSAVRNRSKACLHRLRGSALSRAASPSAAAQR